jgi:hypothetical protein
MFDYFNQFIGESIFTKKDETYAGPFTVSDAKVLGAKQAYVHHDDSYSQYTMYMGRDIMLNFIGSRPDCLLAGITVVKRKEKVAGQRNGPWDFEHYGVYSALVTTAGIYGNKLSWYTGSRDRHPKYEDPFLKESPILDQGSLIFTPEVKAKLDELGFEKLVSFERRTKMYRGRINSKKFDL